MQPVAVEADTPHVTKRQWFKGQGTTMCKCTIFFVYIKKKKQIWMGSGTIHICTSRLQVARSTMFWCTVVVREWDFLLTSRWPCSWCIRTPNREDSCPYSLQVAQAIMRIKAHFKIQGMQHVWAVNFIFKGEDEACSTILLVSKEYLVVFKSHHWWK